MPKTATQTGSGSHLVLDETAIALPAGSQGLLDERDLREIEQAHAQGVTSKQIVDLFEARGLQMSEATLRKYVQLGLLPRSLRVGRKGKHKGSCGLYPPVTIRRINAIKGLMSQSFTIEDIQRSFLRYKDDVETVERGLHELLTALSREVETGELSASQSKQLARELDEVRRLAAELIRRISGLERELCAPRKPDPVNRADAIAGEGETW